MNVVSDDSTLHHGEAGDEATSTGNATRLNPTWRPLGGLYVHESGVPGSPAIVFLQGSAASGGMWKKHMAELRGYHCLAPDLPGFGRSNRVRWRSRIATADLIAELIETRIPTRKAHLVGLSLGGSVAHELLARRADLLDRVIIDGCGALPWWGNGLVLAGITALSPFLHAPPVVAAISRMVGGMDEAGKADIRAASRVAFLRSFVGAFAVRITPAEVAAPCPTLFVAGEHESAVRPSNSALAALMPHAVAAFVPGAGHGWLGVKPNMHLAMVEAWLAGSQLPEGLSLETIRWPEATVERLVARRT